MTCLVNGRRIQCDTKFTLLTVSDGLGKSLGSAKVFPRRRQRIVIYVANVKFASDAITISSPSLNINASVVKTNNWLIIWWRSEGIPLLFIVVDWSGGWKISGFTELNESCHGLLIGYGFTQSSTSLFLCFLLLWKWLRHSFFICARTAHSLICTRAPPPGELWNCFKKTKWITPSSICRLNIKEILGVWWL